MNHSPLMRITSAFIASLMAVCPFSMGGNLPTGANVTHGNVGISTNGRNMQIDQISGQAIVNWESFGIGAGHAVNVSQPDASAAMLSRVIGSDPSAIFGSLTANGSFYLVNPNGVYFGPDSSVDVHSLIASTLDISDADFLAGKLAFSGDSDGVITNDGALSAMATIALLAREVRNNGSIAAANVGIAAGQSVLIDLVAGGKIKLKLDRLAGNSGVAELNADSVINSAGGEIVILSDNDTFFRDGASVDAGSGFVEISGTNYVLIAGDLTAGEIFIDPADLDVDTDVIAPGNITLQASGNININAGVTVQSTGGSVSVSADDNTVVGNTPGTGDVTAGAGAIIDAFTDLSISGVGVTLTDATITVGDNLSIVATGDVAIPGISANSFDISGVGITATGNLVASAGTGSIVGTGAVNIAAANASGDLIIDGVGVTATGNLSGTDATINGSTGDTTVVGVSGESVSLDGAIVTATGILSAAQGNMYVSAGTSANLVELSASNGTVTVESPGHISLVSATADDILTLEGGSVTATGSISSLNDVLVDADIGDINVADVTGSSVGLGSSGGAVTASGLVKSTGAGDVAIQADTHIMVSDVTAENGSVFLVADNTLSFGALSAIGDVFIDNGIVTGSGHISAGDVVKIHTTQDVDITSASGNSVEIDGGIVTATGTLTANSGSIDIEAGTGPASTAALTADTEITVIGFGITATGDISAGDSVVLTDHGSDISAQSVSGSSLDLTGATISSSDLTATNGSIIIAGDSASFANASATNGSVVVTGTGDVLSFDSITATGDVNLSGWGVTERSQNNRSVGGVQGADIIIQGNRKDVLLSFVQGSDVTISGKAVSATDVTATTTNGDIEVTATEAASFSSLNASSGLVDINAVGITVTGATSAAGTVILNGNTGAVAVQNVTANGAGSPSLQISGDSIQLNGDLLTQSGGQDISLQAVNNITGMNHGIDALGDVSIDSTSGGINLGADSLIEIDGILAVTAETGITLGDIEGQDLNVGDNLTSDVSIANSQADDFTGIQGLVVTVDYILGPGGVDLDAGDSITTGDVDFSGNFTADAPTLIELGRVSQSFPTSNIRVGQSTAPDEYIGEFMDTNGEILITAGSVDISSGSVSANTDGSGADALTIRATKTAGQPLTIFEATSEGGPLTLEGGSIDIAGSGFGGVDAGTGAVVINGNSGTVDSDSPITGATVDIDGAAITATDTIQSTNGAITVDGDSTDLADLDSDSGGTMITTTGALGVNSINSEMRISLIGGSISASSSLIATGDITLNSSGLVDIDGSIDGGIVDIIATGNIDLADVTAASKDGDSDGINLLGADIHATGTLTADTGNVDIDGDSAAIDTGIDAQGHIDISATGDISSFILQSRFGSVMLDSSAGNISIANGGRIDALQDVTITSPGSVNINGDIGQTAPIDNLTVSNPGVFTIAGDIDANGVVDITATDVTVAGITARDIAAANRSILIDAAGSVQLNGDLLTEGSGQNVWIRAANDITGMNHVITTVGIVNLDSTSGGVDLGAGSIIDSGANIDVFSETGINLGTLNSGLVSGSGKIVLGDYLTADVTVANSATTIGGFVEINGKDVSVNSVTATAQIGGLGIDIEAGNSIDATGALLTSVSGDGIQLDAANTITTSTIDALGAVQIDASTTITIDDTTAGGDILIGQNTAADTNTAESLSAAGAITIDGGQITINGDVSADTDNGGGEAIDIGATKNSGLDLQISGNASTNGGGITLDGGGRILLDDGSVVNANGGAITVTAQDEVFINSLVTSGAGAVSVTSQNEGIYDNGDSHIDIDTPGLVTLSAPKHIGRVNAGDTLVNPAGSTPKAADGNALDTRVTSLVAATTAADAEIAIDNTGDVLTLGSAFFINFLSPSAGAKGALWVRNDLDLTVANWQIDTDDDIGLISTQGNVTIPGKAEAISGLEQELTDADIVIGAGTARLEAFGNVLAGGDLSVIASNLLLKSTTAPTIHTLVNSADIALDGPGAALTLIQYNGASGFAADLTVQDLDNDGNAIITNGGVIDVTLMNGYDFVTDDGTLTVEDAVSANHADITFTVNAAASRANGELIIANSATVATDSSGDKGGSLDISGHVTTNGQLLANTGETLTLSAVPGQITFTGPQAGAGNVTLDPGGSNQHNIIFSPEGRLEVNGGTLTITNVDTFGMQGASRIDVRGGDVIVNNALIVNMSPDSTITATGYVSISASQEIALGHITSDTDGNGGNITVNNSFLPPRAPGDITISGVLNASGNDITLAAAGAIIATGFGETVNTDLLTLTAGTNIGSATSPIDADALRVDASANAAVWINNTPRADVTDLEINTTGDIVYSQQGNNLTINGNGLTSAGGNITIDPPADIVVAAAIDSAGGDLTIFNTGNFTQNTGIVITTGAGDTHIQSGGNVAIDAITTTDILIVSGGTIAETAADGGVEITGSVIELIADGNIGLLQLTGNTRIDASSQGTVNLETAADFNLGHIAGTDITLVSAGAINDANAGDLNLVGPNATLTANSGSIAADSALDTITATASAGITLDESDDITLTSLTSAGDITVTSDGSVMTDAIATGSNALSIQAENAITIGTAIANGAGDISFRATTGSVTNTASVSGAAIAIAAGDSINVTETITGTGIVNLDADNAVDIDFAVSGAQVDIAARGIGNAVQSDAAISATSGDATITTPNGAILANSAINATGGGVRLSAETTAMVTSIDADSEVSIVADGSISASAAISGADVSIESTTADLDLNGTVIATDSLSLLADTGIDTALALGGTTLSANAATITTHGSVSGNTDFTASGTITTNGNISGGDINIESTGANLDLNGTVIANDSLTLAAATGIDAADSLGGSRVTITAAIIDTQAGADIITVGGDIVLSSAGAITLADLLSSTNDISITSDSTVTSTAGISANSDILVNASSISLATAAAGNDLYLDGTTGVTTAGNISAGSDLTVIGSLLSFGGTVTGGILGQVTLLGTGGDITLVETVAGGNVEVNASGNVVLDGLTSQIGDIHIQAGGSITLNDAIASGGSLFVHAGTGISHAGAFAVTAVSQVHLRAEGGDVFQAAGASTSAGDDIRIDASADVHLVSYSTTGDDVRIEAGGHIIDADGASTVLINAPTATLTMHALSIGNVGSDDVDVDVARLVATTNGLDGDADLALDDENTIIIDRAETLDGDVSVDAINIIVHGSVIAGDVNGGSTNEVDIEADQDLTVNGSIVADDDIILYAHNDLTNTGSIQSGGDALLYAHDNISMTAGLITADNHIDIRADYDFDANSVDDGAGSISQTGGIIGSGVENLFAFADDGMLFSTTRVRTAQLLNGNPTVATGSGNIELHNQNVDLDLIDDGGLPFAVNNLAVAGDILISGQGNIIVAHNVLGLNNIEIEAGQDLTLTNAGVAVAHSTTSEIANVAAIGTGNISLSADGALTLGSNTNVNAGSGTIVAEAEQGIILSELTTSNATGSAVTVTSHTGSVTGDNSQVDIVADSAGAGTTISAATGIGTGGDFLDTTVDTLGAHVTGDGGIWIDENTTITLDNIDTHDGHIVITADDSMLADDVIAGTENILAGNGTVTLTATSGTITVDTVSAPLDTVNITSAGDLVEDGTDAAADIVGGVINLVSGGLIGLDANPIEIDALLELNATSTGNINLTDVIDDFPVGAIDAGSATVVLLANDDQGGDDAAAIIDAVDGGTDIIAGHAELTALNGIGVGRQGTAGDLDVNVDSLEATVTRKGDINIDEVDSLEVTSAVTADGDIAVRAADSIAIGIIDGDQNADNDVILWAGANITDAQSDTATDIFAGGLIDLTVDKGAIGTADEILEVIAGDALHLTALDLTPRGEFWAVLTGTAGGTDTPRYVTYTGRGDVPPARIFWNGDIIGGQEDQILSYQEAESVFALTRGLTDDIAAFGPTSFLHAALLLDEYYTIRAIDFLHPGHGRVTFPDGTDIIDIQTLVDDIIAAPAATAEASEDADESTEPEAEPSSGEPVSAEPSSEQASVKSTPARVLN